MGRILTFVGVVFDWIALLAPYVIAFIVLFFLAKNVLAVRKRREKFDFDCFAIGCFETLKEFWTFLKVVGRFLQERSNKINEEEQKKMEEHK